MQDLPKSCLFSCLFSLQERGVEGEGKEFAGASLDEVDAFGTVEEYADELVVALLGLEQDLAAGSAGCDGGGSEGAVGVGGYGKGYYRLVGVGGSGIEEGGALSAESRGVGGILLIGAGDHGAVGKQRGSAHVEVGVGGIAALGSGLGGIDEEQTVGIDSFNIGDGEVEDTGVSHAVNGEDLSTGPTFEPRGPIG